MTKLGFEKYLIHMQEITGLDRSEILSGCESIKNFNQLDAISLLQIARNLNVDPIKLWQESLDLEVLKNYRLGSVSLPQCYSQVKSSNIISLINVLEQFKQYDLYNYALLKLQIDKVALSQSTTISILAINDLLEYSNGIFTEEDYQRIAASNARFLYEKKFSQEVYPNDTPLKRVKTMVELACEFERNWNYNIISSDLNSIIVESKESEEMRASLFYKPYTNKITNHCRFHFIKEILKLAGIEKSEVTELSDWENNQRKFYFQIKLNQTRQLSYYH